MSTTINWQDLTTEQKDRLIDEKVMKRNDAEGKQTIAWTGRDMLFEIAKQLIEEDEVSTLPVPSYTTSMDAAWLIVEKMHKQYDVRLEMEQENNVRYYVQVWARDRDKMVGYGDSNESMAVAIGVAALRTTGYEVKNA